MSRFQQVKHPSRHPQLTAVYQQIVDHGLGTERPINWFTAQSIRPDILTATWTFVRGLLLQGQLPPTLKQMIILKISTDNQCRYCRVLHRNALQAMGVPDEVIDSVTTEVSPAKLPPVQRAIVEFAAKTATDPKSLSEEDFQQLAQYGLSEGEIMEVAMTAAFANFINTWADVSGILIEGESQPA